MLRQCWRRLTSAWKRRQCWVVTFSLTRAAVVCVPLFALGTYLHYTYIKPLAFSRESPLRCAQHIKQAAAENQEIDSATKDALTLLADTIDFPKVVSFRSRLAATMHVTSAEEVRKRLETSGTPCWAGGLPKLGICTLSSGAAPFVQEWVAHNLLLGTRRIVFYDNDDPESVSSLEFRRAVRPFVDAGYVDIVDWFFRPSADLLSDTFRQVAAENDCLEKYKSDLDWIAMIDLDEFLVLQWQPLSTSCFTQVLADHSRDVGLLVPWREFSPLGVPSHHHSRTSLNQYRYGAVTKPEEPVQCKSVVNTRHVSRMVHPHYAAYAGWRQAVDAVGNPSPDYMSRPPADWENSSSHWNPYAYMELRHYWARDLESMVFDKICGIAFERNMYAAARAKIGVRLLDAKCLAYHAENFSHHQEPLENFLRGSLVS